MSLIDTYRWNHEPVLLFLVRVDPRIKHHSCRLYDTVGPMTFSILHHRPWRFGYRAPCLVWNDGYHQLVPSLQRYLQKQLLQHINFHCVCSYVSILIGENKMTLPTTYLAPNENYASTKLCAISPIRTGYLSNSSCCRIEGSAKVLTLSLSNLHWSRCDQKCSSFSET